MFSDHLFGSGLLWHLVTRLGEAQLALPLALFTALIRVRHAGTRALAPWWTGLFACAVILTLASKVAFIGWGIGSAELDFTGVSGHAMFAAAVYPPLAAALASNRAPMARRLSIVGGCVLALLVGVSRLVLGAHSLSEVVAGWLAGGGVACAALAMPREGREEMGAILPVAAVVAIVALSAAQPSVDTQRVVGRIALRLSGHERPYTRSDMLRRLRTRNTSSG